MFPKTISLNVPSTKLMGVKHYLMVLLMLSFSFYKLISQYYIQLLIFAALPTNSTVGHVGEIFLLFLH